jgi:hypothetical protein
MKGGEVLLKVQMMDGAQTSTGKKRSLNWSDKYQLSCQKSPSFVKKSLICLIKFMMLTCSGKSKIR